MYLHNYLLRVSPVSWSCKIHCISAEEQDPCHECPRYDSKQSDIEAPIMLGKMTILNSGIEHHFAIIEMFYMTGDCNEILIIIHQSFWNINIVASCCYSENNEFLGHLGYRRRIYVAKIDTNFKVGWEINTINA